MKRLASHIARMAHDVSPGGIRIRRFAARQHLSVAVFSCLLLAFGMGSMPVAAPSEASTPEPALPATEYEVEIPCQVGVFVDEMNPTTNNNGAMQGDYLRVGTSTEFCGQYWTLLDIGPIAESDGGLLPDDATIVEAKIKIRKESGPSDTIKVYGLQTAFNEGTATWNNKPSRHNSPTANTTVPSSNGWTYLNIPEFVLTDAIDYSHGLRVALCPTWTTCSRSISFYSDEHTYRPSLVITYIGTEPEPTPTPDPTVDDYEPCNLQVTWSPSIPSPGQEVTVTATATDNEEMRYVAIYRGSVELARRDATSGQDSLSVSYTEEAELPAMSYLVAAKDASPHTTQVLQSLTVPVRGTGTAPEVAVDIDWEIEEVLPERYRLIREDGQVATITCTATDPEGIDYMDIQCTGMGALHIDGGGRQTVTGEFEWVNDDPGATTFSCRLSAVDLEGNYASTDPDYIDIVRPGNLLFMTTGAPGFHNPSRDRLPWERMVQAFGVGECYWWPEEWKSPYALIWYHASFKSIADGGECFGMSTMANELYRGRIIANDVDPTVSAPSYMTYDNSFTKEYVEARQGGQMGGEVAFKRINEDFHTVSEKLNRIKADMAADTPGVLCMWEGDGGHAVVPWMSREMPDGTTRVYIYDCNREGGIVSTRDNGIDNPLFNFHNERHYPFVEFDGSSWSYIWGDGSTWNDTLAYIDYEEACGDMDQENPIAGPFNPHLTDHDIPSVFQYLFAPIGGDVDMVVEDEDGNVTGIYDGEIVEDIPDSMAMIPTMGGPFTEHEMYVLPTDKKLKLRISGNSDDEYVLGLLANGVLMAIEQKDLSEGAEDVITIEPRGDVLGHVMRVKPGREDSSFRLIVAVMFEGLTVATDSDFVGREYIMEGIMGLGDIDFSVFVEEGGDTLVVENHGEDDLVFDPSFRTTESLDEVDDPLDELPFIPSSGEEDVTVGPGETVELTPETWATTEERASLHILRDGKESGPQRSSFPVLPAVIGGVVAAAVAAFIILVRKGIIRVGKPE